MWFPTKIFKSFQNLECHWLHRSAQFCFIEKFKKFYVCILLNALQFLNFWYSNKCLKWCLMNFICKHLLGSFLSSKFHGFELNVLLAWNNCKMMYNKINWQCLCWKCRGINRKIFCIQFLKCLWFYNTLMQFYYQNVM